MFYIIVERVKCLHFSSPSDDIWKKFYPDANIDAKINSSQRVTQGNNVFIDSVLFKEFSDTGVIQISTYNPENKVLVSKSSFINCSNRDNGGCIQYSRSGHIIQYKVCSLDPFSPGGSGSHSYIDLRETNEGKDYVIESTFAQSSGKSGAFDHDYGSILLSLINISDSNSKNNVNYVIGYPTTLATVNFSQFKNNTANVTSCFQHLYSEHKFIYCNVVENSIEGSDPLFFIQQPQLTINRCYFKGNKAYYFTEAWGGTAYLSESHFEPDNVFSHTLLNSNPIEMGQIVFDNYYSYCFYLFSLLRKPDKTLVIDNPKINIIHLYSIVSQLL
ncbi:hypothetical protein TVAG_180580 [Trichomonas vaginalis G3]|uniref:Right handed beta helix domain-containing protein n=1 Tax=Trichomonas vaginalis (strain ATCC PRA-98 / G3) TaxID=412133 RepID=A2EE86_TRIV3|nr:hypothetical protein TVAGG3_0614040 [Trichomonas vaginalis G3]EAY09083.1 hypothetical protein TVAG_180580 [Trichomonas vaginalis G3]KAI5503402.1 hypothetical protein TVAGG3_0614040 [Trichomonas vaginalis G3]|eukprot:XP_001321306.1 hypothetical protein [Trichomonas vaginalis G3]